MVSLLDFIKWNKRSELERNLRALAIGVNSHVDIDNHIVMLDYDVQEIDKVIDSIIELQEFWNLSDAWIHQTTNGHHVFFWYDQVPYGRLKQIIDFARHVDPMYKYISKYHNHKTLRISGKYRKRDIYFIDTIKGRRKPTIDEVEIGELKRAERGSLAQNTNTEFIGTCGPSATSAKFNRKIFEKQKSYR
jgi:hypothetical protein